jgi:hypothetical protein
VIKAYAHITLENSLAVSALQGSGFKARCGVAFLLRPMNQCGGRGLGRRIQSRLESDQ